MTTRFKICLLVCVLFAFIQLAGCIDVSVRQPSTQHEPASSDQSLSTKPAPSAEGDGVLESAETWVTYTSDQGGLSFKYPKGWKVEADESVIAIDNAETDE